MQDESLPVSTGRHSTLRRLHLATNQTEYPEPLSSRKVKQLKTQTRFSNSGKHCQRTYLTGYSSLHLLLAAHFSSRCEYFFKKGFRG